MTPLDPAGPRWTPLDPAGPRCCLGKLVKTNLEIQKNHRGHSQQVPVSNQNRDKDYELPLILNKLPSMWLKYMLIAWKLSQFTDEDRVRQSKASLLF